MKMYELQKELATSRGEESPPPPGGLSPKRADSVACKDVREDEGVLDPMDVFTNYSSGYSRA